MSRRENTVKVGTKVLRTTAPTAPPVYSGGDGHCEGPLCVWQVGGGHNPVGPCRQVADAAHFLGVAMWHTAQQRLLEKQGGRALAPTVRWNLGRHRLTRKPVHGAERSPVLSLSWAALSQAQSSPAWGHAEGVLGWSRPGCSLLGPPGASCLAPHHTWRSNSSPKLGSLLTEALPPLPGNPIRCQVPMPGNHPNCPCLGPETPTGHRHFSPSSWSLCSWEWGFLSSSAHSLGYRTFSIRNSYPPPRSPVLQASCAPSPLRSWNAGHFTLPV